MAVQRSRNRSSAGELSVSVGARPLQLERHVGDGAEEVRHLDREWDRHVPPHVAHQLEIRPLHLAAALDGVRGDEVRIQLERVGAGLLDGACEFDPAARRDAVQARDDRHVHRGLRPPHVLQIRVGPERVEGSLGEVRQRLGIAVRAVGEVVVEVVPFDRELLLEERRQHDRAGAGVFGTANEIEILGHGRGREDEWGRQGEAQIARGEIDHGRSPGMAAIRS
jgi:hypothetical protein